MNWRIIKTYYVVVLNILTGLMSSPLWIFTPNLNNR